MGHDRHLFPGGNTTQGFFSYYPYILPQDKANHIYCIKGGPGVGKSTFMKQIGKAMGEEGFAVEYMHCSSDPGSLDGLVIPSLKTALIDGTAPHVVDPKNPGAVDEIINLGEHWDLQGIKRHRDDIMRDNADVGRLFTRVYRLLGAARRINEDIESIHGRYTNLAGVDAELEKLLPRFGNRRPGERLGFERKLFASAITPEGLVHYLDTLVVDCQQVYRLEGPGRLPSLLLNRLADEAARRGLDVEEFYCPMDPADKIEHLLIPELSVAFLTGNRFHRPSMEPTGVIDLGIHSGMPSSSDKEDLEYDEQALDGLLEEAIATLRRAKALHDHMETFYIPNMDFDAISRVRSQILGRILGG